MQSRPTAVAADNRLHWSHLSAPPTVREHLAGLRFCHRAPRRGEGEAEEHHVDHAHDGEAETHLVDHGFAHVDGTAHAIPASPVTADAIPAGFTTAGTISTAPRVTADVEVLVNQSPAVCSMDPTMDDICSSIRSQSRPTAVAADNRLHWSHLVAPPTFREHLAGLGFCHRAVRRCEGEAEEHHIDHGHEGQAETHLVDHGFAHVDGTAHAIPASPVTDDAIPAGVITAGDISTPDWVTGDARFAHPVVAGAIPAPLVRQRYMMPPLCSFFDPSMVGKCHLPFADGTSWPNCPWSKSAYIKQGGYVNPYNKIVKPRFVITEERSAMDCDATGDTWDICRLCSTLAKQSYCVLGHLLSDRHLRNMEKHPEFCRVDFVIPPPPPNDPALSPRPLRPLTPPGEQHPDLCHIDIVVPPPSLDATALPSPLLRPSTPGGEWF